MNDKITLKEFFDSKENLTICCNTEAKTNKLCEEFNKLGKTWKDGTSYLDFNFSDTFPKSIVYSNDGTFYGLENAKKNKYKIYEFEDVIFKED